MVLILAWSAELDWLFLLSINSSKTCGVHDGPKGVEVSHESEPAARKTFNA